MITVGGTTYSWRGKNIRSIEYQGIRCVTMPRKDSTIVIPAKISTKSFYKIKVTARNKGGNGKILIGFDDIISESVYIVSSDFEEYHIDIDTDNISAPIHNLIVSRPKDSSGSVLIEKIEYEKTERPKTKKEIELEVAAEEKEESLKKRNRIGKLQASLSVKHREGSKKISVARGDVVGRPEIIGGKGYKWKGKNIRSVFKGGSTCVVLQRIGSMILSQVLVPQKVNFEVVIRASGTGTLMVNFFGGQKFDGKQARIEIKGEQVLKYTVKIGTPGFPANTKMYLRAWIPYNGANGSICIKDITYQQSTKKEIAKPRTPRIPHTKILKQRLRPKSGKLHRPKEIYDMKFKPYGFIKVSDKSLEVLVANAEQVPLVSIITPTRDGIDLLKKCYAALNNNTAYPNWEWVIGDSDSKDGTADYIKKLEDPRIKLVERGTTDGSFSTINNELTEHASGEYYLFLNDDTEAQPFWLYEMMSKIYNRESIGIVGAKLMHSESRVQHAGIMFTLNGPGNIGKPMLKIFGGMGFANQDRFYQAVTGACLLIRSKDFRKVGGFDPVYWFCYEDIDLCLKIKHNLNKKILYAANAVLLHVESATQKKFGTSGKKQKEGVKIFKQRWMNKVEIDMPKFALDPKKGLHKVDVSFVTCVNNVQQYSKYTVGSLFLNGTNKNYEIIPIFNTNNRYSAAKALNLGIERARGGVIVLCHQDVLFYKGWVNSLFSRIKEIGNNKWGVLGTAGITEKDKTVGVVYNLKGKMQWRQSARGKVFPVQTVDEHCMIIRKNSGLKFDERTFDGFHCYGPDICLNALSRKMRNYGILCPLVHDSGSGSLQSGKKEFMRLLLALSNKWGKHFRRIRTTTSSIIKGKIKTFISFK